MLVLSRQIDKGIVITHVQTGQRMRLEVVDIRGNKVRLGLEGSPEEFTFHRDEVQRQIDTEACGAGASRGKEGLAAAGNEDPRPLSFTGGQNHGEE